MGNDVKMCQCCGRAKVAGYVPHYRVTLEKLCTKCWKKGGVASLPETGGSVPVKKGGQP